MSTITDCNQLQLSTVFWDLVSFAEAAATVLIMVVCVFVILAWVIEQYLGK